MRNFLNAILSQIGSTSLTDDEFESCTATEQDYNQMTYDDLAGVLESRESVSTFQERLIAYYKIKNFDVAPNTTGKSNIFVGSVL